MKAQDLIPLQLRLLPSTPAGTVPAHSERYSYLLYHALVFYLEPTALRAAPHIPFPCSFRPTVILGGSS